MGINRHHFSRNCRWSCGAMLIALTSMLPASADTFVMLSGSSKKADANIHLLDWSRLRAFGNNYRTWSYAGYRLDGVDHRLAILTEYDCAEQRSRMIAVSSMDAAGKAISNDDAADDWTYPMPGSRDSTALETVCAKEPAPDRLIEGDSWLKLVNNFFAAVNR